MIDVRVRQHHRGNVFARERKVPVAIFGFLSAALILAAIQQITIVADHQLMHGAGNHLGRAPECQFHPLKNTLRFRLLTRAAQNRDLALLNPDRKGGGPPKVNPRLVLLPY